MKRKVPKQWTPVKRGLIYCSPACGNKCTYAEFQKRKKEGVALAKKLGKGWSYTVWENSGWHQKVISPTGDVEIYPPSPLRFWATTTRNFTPQLCCSHRTAKGAFQGVVNQAKALSRSVDRLIERLLHE